LVNREKALAIFKVARRRKIKWRCLVRLNHLDPEILKIMARSGCQEIGVGIETGSEAMQRYSKKNLDLFDVLEKIHAGVDQGISMNLFFIIGYPDETEQDINRTLRLALNCRLLGAIVQLRLLALEKGSDLFAQDAVLLINDRILTYFNRLSDEKKLILEHPQLFPQFGVIKNRYLKVKLLIKTQIIFMFLMEFFPALTFELLSKKNLSPLTLVKQLVSSFEGQGLKEWKFSWDMRGNLECYRPYFRNFIDRNFKASPRN
jgi:hypothetical protein